MALGPFLLAPAVHQAVPFGLSGLVNRALKLLLRALWLHAAGCSLLLLLADPLVLVPRRLLARLLGCRGARVLLLPRQYLLDVAKTQLVSVSFL